MNNDITLLDELTANKIAAGEVAESPVSIVKELIENSIDAGASQITVEIRDGGKSLIKVSDDGYGIKPDQIELAFTRHATSKIRSIEDFQRLNTNGFRGEALSSIASVSKIDIVTNISSDAIGVRATLIDSKVTEISPAGARRGTTVSVMDLFYNTPARKKFLRPGNREASSIIDIVTRLAIINTKIRFKLISDGKEVISTDGDGISLNAIRTLYGKNLASNLIKTSFSNEYISIEGYISNTSLYASNRKKQNIFINKRYVKLNRLNYIVESLYKELIPIGKFPIFILDIEIHPEYVDPNIHPSKTEVKIDDSVSLDEILSSNLRKSLFSSSANLIPQYRQDKNEVASVKEKTEFKEGFIYKESDKIEEESVVKIRERAANIEIPYSSMLQQMETYKHSTSYSYDSDSGTEPDEPEKNETTQVEIADEAIFDYNKFVPAGVVLDTYIVATYAEEMYLIDQHAAHERIMYEKFMNQYDLNKNSDDSRFESQELLIPVIKELTMDEYITVLENHDIFDFFGMKLDDFGFGNIALRSLPLIFNTEQSALFFDEIKDIIMREKNIDLNDKFRDRLASMACKKAIKANQKIENEEIKTIFSKLNVCENKYTCPHGRPIFVKFSKYEIEKMFKRKNA